MSDSYTNLLYHIVFSTKDRRTLITSEIEPRLYDYIGGTVRGLGVSQSNVEQVRHYIARQKEHHTKVSFRDEFIQFLKANGIEYDERYV